MTFNIDYFLSASHPWTAELYDKDGQVTARTHGAHTAKHMVSSFSGLCSTRLHCVLHVDKSPQIITSWPVAHCGERARLLLTRQRHVSHTGVLCAALAPAAVGARELLPCGAVQREGCCWWSWSHTAFPGWGGGRPFSSLSHTAPMLGLATVHLTC